MSLILAIEPDRRQAAKVYALADTLRVELIHGETTETALAALGVRQPDLVLTSQLLSPKDEAALADRLRELDAAGAHVATLVIPVLRGEEGGEKKTKKGGLFGRLRRNKDEKTTEGCEPSVFGAEITEYLERAAAERAALAQAQADLEAAWADAPAPAPAAEPVSTPTVASADAALDALFSQPSAYDTSAVASPVITTSVDVHPGMVIEDPEALFGEFAAIPIRRADAADTVAPSMVMTNAPTIDGDAITAAGQNDENDDNGEHAENAGNADNGDIAANFAALFGPASSEPDGTAAYDDQTDDGLMAASTARPAAAAHEDEWEEIALDTGDESARHLEASEHRAPEHHVELASGSVDFDDFVRELETVKSSANAQPMIPVVDLSHVLAGDVDLREPEIVSELQIKEEARATFDAEVAAVFATEPEIAFEAEPELAEEPVVHVAPVETVFAALAEPPTESTTESIPDAMPEWTPAPSPEPIPEWTTEPATESMPEPVAEPTPKPPTLWPEFPDLKTPAWQPPTETPAAPERWRAAIETLQAPTVSAPSADVSVVKEPAMKPGWQNMLSAMRRDIDQGRKEDEAPAVTKPRPELNTEPLVFPKRPTVTASLISNIEAPKAFKQPIDATPAPDLQAPAAALQKLLETVVVAPKAEPAASEMAIADSVGSEAAALEAALSGINVADVAGGEKIERQPDLSSNPVWAGGASLAASLEVAVEEPVLTADAMSPESAAPELQTVDLSWLNAPAAVSVADAAQTVATAAAETEAAVVPTVTNDVVTETIDELSLEELERLTRPATETAPIDVAPVTASMHTFQPLPVAPEPTAVVEPVVVAPVVVAPVIVAPVVVSHVGVSPVDVSSDPPADNEWKAQRGTKSKKKRKQGQSAQASQASKTAPAPPPVRAVDEDFGFFDPHRQGFMPLLARLNQITASGMPLR